MGASVKHFLRKTFGLAARPDTQRCGETALLMSGAFPRIKARVLACVDEDRRVLSLPWPGLA